MLINRKSIIGRGLLLPSEMFENSRGLADRNSTAWLCAFGVLLPKVLLREKSEASTCHLVRPHLSGPLQSLQWCYMMGFQSIPCLTSYIHTHISSVIVSQGKSPHYWGWPLTSSQFSFCLLSESILPQNL